jgi:hypothetical protein
MARIGDKTVAYRGLEGGREGKNHLEDLKG